MKKVLAVTGIRSDYFFSKPIYSAIEKSSKLELGLVVSGAHLTHFHGYSINDVTQDGLNVIAKIDNLLASNSLSSRLKSASIQMQGLIQVIEQYKPDLLFAVADREEPMVTAMCGAYLNIPVVHYCAGDRSMGNIDSTVRQAVSDLSHILLTTCDDSKQRLLKRGEEAWRIHNVGFAGIDRIKETQALSKEVVESMLGLPRGHLEEKPYFVVIQHPISSQVEQSFDQMLKTMRVLSQFKDVTFVVSHPNTDAGSEEIRTVISDYVKSHDHIHSFSNIDDAVFINLLRGSQGLIGNSSMGVYEAPYYGLPVLNIGRRQIGRYHSNNMNYVDNDEAEIYSGIKEMLSKTKPEYFNPFGDGHTASKIVNILENLEINESLLNKKLVY
ncbi:MAG: UDP-N-acetylglucosamine 2-epimerase (hydrolyzing) [Methyloprofundus sp.]|nr:UDP-N-acetylglucosamine 2-epimerase (hydrolyzing) [Methyloprofundus sp.]